MVSANPAAVISWSLACRMKLCCAPYSCPLGWSTVALAKAARMVSRSRFAAASCAGLTWMRMAGFCKPPMPTRPTPGSWEIFCARMELA